MSTDPELVLRLALVRDAEATMAALGISQARVTQWALRLAHDPAVAAEHPMLAQRVRTIVDAGKRQRRARF